MELNLFFAFKIIFQVKEKLRKDEKQFEKLRKRLRGKTTIQKEPFHSPLEPKQ
jgi:hypothetical protein